MAHIVIITHTRDNFQSGGYLLSSFIAHWSKSGHRVSVAPGPNAGADGDIAILHLDLSVVPSAYVEACRRFPVVLNGAALDIRKRVVSRHLVQPGDDWPGPVIIKSDLNFGGLPEWLHSLKSAGSVPPGRFAPPHRPYPILPSARYVPDAVWSNPGLVVERFLPEQDARGFWVRAWVFLGDRERCTRYLGPDPIVKTSNIVAREPARVPRELRAERKRLGLDYGKFDFVMRDGKAILFDANKTPAGPPRSTNPRVNASNARLARGLDMYLRR